MKRTNPILFLNIVSMDSFTQQELLWFAQSNDALNMETLVRNFSIIPACSNSESCPFLRKVGNFAPVSYIANKSWTLKPLSTMIWSLGSTSHGNMLLHKSSVTGRSTIEIRGVWKKSSRCRSNYCFQCIPILVWRINCLLFNSLLGFLDGAFHSI